MKMKNLTCLLCLALAVAGAAVAGDKEGGEPRRPALAFYTFGDLLEKAERIIVAEVGPQQDGATLLLVHETIKAPVEDAKNSDPKNSGPERLKRAAELLANENAPSRVRVLVEDLRLPPEGTQAIFFLWDKPAGNAPAEPAYRVAHPQCIYELELLGQVKAAAARPRSVADGRYLREWDKQMAARARQRQANEALLKTKGGDVVMGLRLRALRPALSLRGDNSFAVTVRVENTRAREQLIYDGPGGGYGVLLRPKNAAAGAGLVLRQGAVKTGADISVLNIADEMDFTAIKGEAFLAKELFFGAAEFPALRNLDGEYTLAVFFNTEQDGRGLEMAGPVWTGSMVAEEVPLQFHARPEHAKLPEP
ncbi:MAG: hypothetical protein ABSE73_05890 [Planctomycetota bacterium]